MSQKYCLRFPAVLRLPTDLAPIHSIYLSFNEASVAQEKYYNETGIVLSITSYN
jgi:hypothetical protein